MKFLYLVGLLALVHAQTDGRYRPIEDGKYRPNDDGKYRPSNDGKYTGNDGRYIHDDVKYVHAEDKFGSSGGSNKNIVTIGGRRTPMRPVFFQPPTGPTSFQPTFSTTTTKTTASPPVPAFAAFAPRASSNVGNDVSGANILRQEHEETIDGYRYLYETENGILAEESGRIEKLASGDDGLRSSGYYQYTGDDGQLYRVDYVADDNGFVPKGDHLPTPPPIPPEIQEVLNILATKPPDVERPGRF